MPSGPPATRAFTFVASDDVAGDALEVDITITPSQTLIWPTSPPKVYADVPFKLSSTVGTVSLPCTDQTGFVDQSGAPITSWAYRVDWGGPGAGDRRSAYYALPGGTTPINLDTAIPLRYV